MTAQQKSQPGVAPGTGFRQHLRPAHPTANPLSPALTHALIRPVRDAEREEQSARRRFQDALTASGLPYSTAMAVYAAGDSWGKARALHMVAFVAVSGAAA